MEKYSTAYGPRFHNLWNWIAFGLYLLITAISISRHELWGDELHSWNIAKGSPDLLSLINNTRYEGHPPLWYLLLFFLSKFTHDPFYIQVLHYVIAAFLAFVFLFFIRLNRSYQLLILFGYFFLYEYSVFSRNYATAVLLSVWLLVLIKKEPVHKWYIYYGLLVLLSNTHFLGLILAASFHVYVLGSIDRKEKNRMAIHALIGFVLLLPALYFIFPASDSGLSTGFWLRSWTREYFFFTADAPLKALCPVPAFWEYHFWNTQVLIGLQNAHPFLKNLNILFSAGLVAVAIYILIPDRRALLMFVTNLAITLLFALVFPLTSVRYTGFIFIGFVTALCLFRDQAALNRSRRILLYMLLSFQLLGALIALKKDWQFPFSHGEAIKAMSNKIPAGEELITDYWCLNYVSAYLDRPVYCLGFDKERSFLLWDTEMTQVARQQDIYTQGITHYFATHAHPQVYFMTTMPAELMKNRDSLFFKTFHPELIAGQNDAIEKHSNIYLYKISPQNK